MSAEVLTVLAIQAGGMALALTTGIRALRFVVPAGFIAGLCVHIAIGAVQGVVLMHARPAVTIALTAALPTAWWYARFRQGLAAAPSAAGAFGALAVVGTAAAALYAIDQMNLRFVDSHEYLAIGVMLAEGTLEEGASMYQLEKRMFAVPLQHASASLSGEYYLASLGPLLGVATVLLLMWLCEAGLRDRLGGVSPLLFVAIPAALLLATNNRFVMNLFFVNSHLLIAALVLLLAGTSWLLATRPEAFPDRGFLALQLVAIPVLVMARPEAAFLAAIVIAPTVLSPRRPLKHRTALVAVLGLSIVTWHVFYLSLVESRGAPVSEATVGMLAFGGAVLAFAPVLQWRALAERPRLALGLVEAALWGTLAIQTIRNPAVLEILLRILRRNTLEGIGGWGYSLAFLVALALIALVATRAPNRMFLRYPPTMFVPFALLLIYLPGVGYRIGAGDSLNRMLFHVVPLVILLIASTAAARPATPASPSPRKGPAGRRFS